MTIEGQNSVIEINIDEVVEEFKTVIEETQSNYDELFQQQQEQLETQKEYIEKSVELLEKQHTTFDTMLEDDNLLLELQAQTLIMNEQLIEMQNVNQTQIYVFGFLIGFLALYVFLREASAKW